MPRRGAVYDRSRELLFTGSPIENNKVVFILIFLFGLSAMIVDADRASNLIVTYVFLSARLILSALTMLSLTILRTEMYFMTQNAIEDAINYHRSFYTLVVHWLLLFLCVLIRGDLGAEKRSVTGLVCITLIIIDGFYMVASGLIFSMMCSFPHATIQIINIINNRSLSNEANREIDKIPIKKYSDIGIESSDTMCTVCLVDYSGDANIMLLRCGHIFHPDCAKEWFKVRIVCPNCLQPPIDYTPDSVIRLHRDRNGYEPI